MDLLENITERLTNFTRVVMDLCRLNLTTRHSGRDLCQMPAHNQFTAALT